MKLKLKCILSCHSTSAHLHQLYTGLWMLHQSGVIELTQRMNSTSVRYANDAPHLKDAGHAHLDVEVNGELRLHFDTHDSMEIALDELQNCDIYFKRSYSPACVAQLSPAQALKVLPLGLNYRVLPNTMDLLGLRRSIMTNGGLRRKVSAVRQAIDVHNLLGFLPRLKHMESAPDFKAPSRVLFLVAAYDPFDDATRAPDKVAERMQMNETRAKCIRLLRKEFGNRFLGGLIATKFAQKNYRDVVISGDMTSQKNYLIVAKTHPICVASKGLHGSIGWKFAEYVALSKAIVSEQLLYEVPGNFECDQNYLKFTSPEGCVEATVQLMQDADLRNALMSNNAAYYQANLRPDSLMRNALLSALTQKSTMVPTFTGDEHRQAECDGIESAS